MKYEEWKANIKAPQQYAIYNATTVKQLLDESHSLEVALRARIEKQQATIHMLEEWITAISDDHSQIPDWIQKSAASLLAEVEYE